MTKNTNETTYKADLVPSGNNEPRHGRQIATQEEARTAGEAALLAESTRRSKWGVGSGRETINFAITEPGATFSAEFLGPDLDNNATCLVVQTETRRPGGGVDRRAYATDFSALVALPTYNPQTGGFGKVGEKVQAWRAGRHPAPVDEDLVVGQSLFGKEGHDVVTAVVMPEAAMAQPTSVFDRIKYDSGDGVIVWHSDRSAPGYKGHRYASGPLREQNMPVIEHPQPNPADSAYGHLLRIKEHYEALEGNIIAGTGQAAISGS